MLVSVLFGSLEVLIYPEDQLPYLQPIYGSAPCPRTPGSRIVESSDSVDDSWRPSPGDGEDGRQVPDDEGRDIIFGERSSSSDGTSNSENGPKAWNSWPHEPRFCASVWSIYDDRANDDPENSYSERYGGGTRSTRTRR